MKLSDWKNRKKIQKIVTEYHIHDINQRNEKHETIQVIRHKDNNQCPNHNVKSQVKALKSCNLN